MTYNVAFLVRKGRIFVSLRSISDCIDVPETDLRQVAHIFGIDDDEGIISNDTLYLTEDGACSLLTDLDELLRVDMKKVERFHNWMHDAYSRISVSESKAEEPPADKPEEPEEPETDSDDDCPLHALLQEIVGILKLQKQRMDRLEDKLGEKA